MWINKVTTTEDLELPEGISELVTGSPVNPVPEHVSGMSGEHGKRGEPSEVLGWFLYLNWSH